MKITERSEAQPHGTDPGEVALGQVYSEYRIPLQNYWVNLPEYYTSRQKYHF